jgi:putative nucleotidyltransferase with HDIG domain
MKRVTAICDSPEEFRLISEQLKGVFDTIFVEPERIAFTGPPGQFSVVSIDLKNVLQIVRLKQWLKSRRKGSKLIFVTQKGSHLEATQAFALGATDIVHRPIDLGPVLLNTWSEFKSLVSAFPAFQPEGHEGITAALGALQEVFSTAVIGGSLDQTEVDRAGEAIIEQIGNKGIHSWIETVRKHHSQTYQHSLLVTGLAIGFGQYIGLGHRDLKRLSFGSILHDIGKARVPVAILEKPAALDEAEDVIIKQHPLFGAEALESMPDVPAEMIDVVLHHHEYIDGSGYPHGLHGSQIPDLVRVMTISDIFGALIERRAYKPPLPADAAYEILVNMGGQLDQPLVREFRHMFYRVLKTA